MARPVVKMPEARDVIGAAERSEVRDAVERFLLVGFAVLLIVAIPVAFWIRAQAENHALENARNMTQRLADFAVGPVVTSELLAGDLASLRALDTLLDPWMDDGSIVRIKIWDADGRIVYSDVPTLIGENYGLEGWARDLLAGGEGTATLEDQTELENSFESGSGELVEVYVSSTAATGDALVFEAYYDGSRVRSEQADLLLNIGPVFLLSLLVLQLAQLVPAVRLARRIQAHQAARGRLLQRAVEASDLERQRIARDLHDEVIQDLAGLSYALEAEELRGTPEHKPLFTRARSILQHNVQALRTITTELYPPDLDELGLPAALARLADPLRERGIEVGLDLDPATAVDRDQAAIFYRVAREAVANTAKHAQAASVELSLLRRAGATVLRIHDDGRGFDVTSGPPEGHLGMRIMQDTIDDAGGTLAVTSRRPGGTTITAALPLPR